MPVATSAKQVSKSTPNGWLMWTLWSAGAALLLVQLHLATEYFDAGLRQNMGNLLGWFPAMGMITLKVAEQSLWHWQALALALQLLPLGALGLLLVGIALAIQKRYGTARNVSVKQ